ncbi:group I truncated hemoglobin [Mumia quercus]|uniref:group I truncated hemoglobin n=1 Tax=Mumia quercus TaxID=2976125 RepID=UPI0021D1199E|nr:group 1 truncated hemoglobin [Mumia quercus]
MTDVDTVQDEQSPYARVGGGAAVRVVVDRFYERVMADPTLAPYFTDSDLTNLKRHQVQLISHLLGGPVSYEGRELRDAHAGLDITPEAYGRVVEHLVGVLVEAGVPDDILASLGETLTAVQPDIVSQQS